MTGRDRPFALALGLWLLAGLVLWLLLTRLGEVLPKTVFALVIAGAFLLAPIALIVWTIVRAVRKRGSWLAVPAVVVATVTLVAAGIPLYPVSIYLNFWSHRSQYDRVIADLKSGRLPRGAELRGHGVTYSAVPGEVFFPWSWDFDIGNGVTYDAPDCVSEPALSTLSPEPAPRAASTGAADPPVMKSAGKLNKFVLDGRYCYFAVP